MIIIVFLFPSEKFDKTAFDVLDELLYSIRYKSLYGNLFI